MTTLTHHKTLARRLAGSTTLTYQQSLQRVRTASQNRELPNTLDAVGLSAAYHRLRTIHRLEEQDASPTEGSTGRPLPLSADLPSTIAPIRDTLATFATDASAGAALEMRLNRFAHLDSDADREAMATAAGAVGDLVDKVHDAGSPYTDTQDVYVYDKSAGPYEAALAELFARYDDDALRALGRIRTLGGPEDERDGGRLELGFLLSTAIAVVRPHRLHWTKVSEDHAEAVLPTPPGCRPLVASAYRIQGSRMPYEGAVRTADYDDRLDYPAEVEIGRTLVEAMSFADSYAARILTDGLRTRTEHSTGRKLWPTSGV